MPYSRVRVPVPAFSTVSYGLPTVTTGFKTSNAVDAKVYTDLSVGHSTAVTLSNLPYGTRAVTVPAIPAATITRSKDPFIPTLISGTTYTPIISAGVRYQNLNNDPELKQKMTSYFYNKLYDQWIFSDFHFMLDNIKVRGEGQISVTKSSSPTTANNMYIKVDFLKNRVMTRETIYRLLHQYVYKSKTNWYDLKRNKQYVKNLIRHKLAKSLRQLSN